MLTIPWASRWCAGYARSQGINSHGTGIPYLQYSGHSMKTIFMQYVYNRFMTPTFKRLRVICSIMFNILRPRQNGRCFLNDTFKHIFLNENVRILIKISLKFVPEGPINNNPALVQIMAWRPSGDKPLSEPMMVSLLTHICITRPQWVHIKKMHDELQMKLPTTPVACTYYNTWHISSEVCFVQYCFRYISTYHRVLVFDLKIFLSHKMLETRTTRAPAFWGYPPPPHDYPYHWVILDPKSKEDKVKVTNLKNAPKFQEMDPMSIVEDTERTRFCPQTDKWTDRQDETSIPHFQLRWSRGYNQWMHT